MGWKKFYPQSLFFPRPLGKEAPLAFFFMAKKKIFNENPMLEQRFNWFLLRFPMLDQWNPIESPSLKPFPKIPKNVKFHFHPTQLKSK